MKLRYRQKPSETWTEVQFPPGTDELAVLEYVRTSMFPGAEVVPEKVEIVKPERKRRRK